MYVSKSRLTSFTYTAWYLESTRTRPEKLHSTSMKSSLNRVHGGNLDGNRSATTDQASKPSITSVECFGYTNKHGDVGVEHLYTRAQEHATPKARHKLLVCPFQGKGGGLYNAGVNHLLEAHSKRVFSRRPQKIKGRGVYSHLSTSSSEGNSFFGMPIGLPVTHNACAIQHQKAEKQRERWATRTGEG